MSFGYKFLDPHLITKEDVKNPPPPRTFRTVRIRRGQSPDEKKSIFWTCPKTAARPSDFENTSMLLHSWRPLTHNSRIECTSPSRSEIQYICSLPLSKWAIDCGFIIKVKPPIEHKINLEVKKYYKTLIIYWGYNFCDSPLKGTLSL